MSTYADSPLARRLRQAWLLKLAAKQRWADFLGHYQATDDVTLDCLRRQALLAGGKENEALRDIESVWLHGRSRPDACDPVFDRWRARGGATADHLWQRFWLALEAGQPGLARYLNRQLRGKRKTAAELALAVHAKPKRVLQQKRFNPADPHLADVLVHGIWRWSRADSVEAAAAWDTLKRRYPLPNGAKTQRLERRLGLFLAARGHPSAANRLAALPPDTVDAEVEEWRVRLALVASDWRLALKWSQQMKPPLREKSAWRYWRGRALEELGRKQEATALYKSLAATRDYYGFLAADRIDLPYRMAHRPSQIDQAAIEAVGRTPGIQRAREFYLLQRLPQARIEWQFTSRSLTRGQLLAAAKLAQSWGWHDRAIATSAAIESWDDLELRFPLPYRQSVLNKARDRGLDPAWIYAVMRQESLFQTDVRSSAGALGLMQIMPGTGRRIAVALKAPKPNRYSLLQTDTNIRFGAYYLHRTLRQLQGNPLLATAAYNAGPSRVRQWLPERRSMPADIWAETIPFRETRRYVKRVMEYATVYEWRLQRSRTRLRERMSPIRPSA